MGQIIFLKMSRHSSIPPLSDAVWVGEIQCKNGISLEKIQNFQNEAPNFSFVLFYLKLLIGATNRGGTEKYSTIPLGILGPSKFTESV